MEKIEKIMGIDDVETFVLEFLAYRRELRERRMANKKQPTYLIEHLQEPEPEPAPRPSYSNNIPHSIGKGWPYYKDFAPQPVQAHNTKPQPVSNQSDIIPTLTPIVSQAINRFGYPTSPKALEHLVNQVIANAMTIPLINESIHTAEITPWGRVPLLQAVIELLIKLHKS